MAIELDISDQGSKRIVQNKSDIMRGSASSVSQYANFMTPPKCIIERERETNAKVSQTFYIRVFSSLVHVRIFL